MFGLRFPPRKVRKFAKDFLRDLSTKPTAAVWSEYLEIPQQGLEPKQGLKVYLEPLGMGHAEKDMRYYQACGKEASSLNR